MAAMMRRWRESLSPVQRQMICSMSAHTVCVLLEVRGCE
jgi:hypothetical protein